MKRDPAELPPLDWQAFILALAFVVLSLSYFIAEWL